MSAPFRPVSSGSAAAIFASPIGPRIACEAPDMAGLARLVEAGNNETKSALTAAAAKIEQVETKADRARGEVDARLSAIEQRITRPGGGGAIEVKSLGAQVVASEEVRALVASQNGGRARVAVETKTILSATGTWGSGVSPSNSLVQADRAPIVGLPRRRLFIRDILPPGQTTSNAIEYPVQASFSNGAAVVAENTTKPLSDLTFDLKTAAVRTIAHRMIASRQILDDAPQLQSVIDSQMRYGLAIAEENELLNGDGTGQHIFGLISAATPFSAPFTIGGETTIDRILLGIAQLEAALYNPSAVVLNPLDFRRMEAVKDGMGRYLIGDPQGTVVPRLWGLPVVASPAISAGYFLLGDFQSAAQLFDRLSVEVLISTEDSDNFSKNMVTIRCEERIAMPVYRPAALLYGQLPTS